MKNFLMLLVIIFQYFFMSISWSESKFEIGEKAYVWAKNGIWLREQPAIDAEKLEELTYGTPLKISSDGIGSYESVALYGKQGPTATYSVTGAWRKVQNINNDNKEGYEGYVFDGWLLTLPPVKCKIKTESEQSCEDIADWGTRNFGLIKKIHKQNGEVGCKGCDITQYIFGKGFVYVEYEPGYGSERELNAPRLSLSEGVVVALGLFSWWDGEKPKIEISKKRIGLVGTYQTLIIELTQKGIKIVDSCRDC